MKRRAGIVIGTTLFVVVFASPAFAQQPAPEGIVIKQERVFQGPDGAPPPPLGHDFVFIATENFGGKVVKGAPYSAEAVTETVQTLSDGNRIVNKNTSHVYRDGEGRTRREDTLKALGGVGTSEEPLQTIFINDPVAGVTYSLDSRTHIAHKSVPFRFELAPKPGGAPAEGQRFEFKVGPGAGAASGVIMTAPAGPPPPGAPAGAPPDVQQFSVRAAEGVAMNYVFKRTGSETNAVKEQLGKQMIEGVEAEGTRTTMTIPAGDIGNERPIEIVSERWYSPELQLVVMTRHSDPRSGETTYKLTNINRAEPAKSLFEVPAGFTVKEMQMRPPNVAPLQRRKMANPE
ncbi:MAG TPA: hypothetical protein VGJ37_08015 [Pyrinomonadaceae bacterium]|jgi:hypothetical protein